MRALSICGVRLFCAYIFRGDGTQSTQTLGKRGQMIRDEMRIAAHHLRRSPAAHFLQRVQRRAILHVPRGPGVATMLS